MTTSNKGKELIKRFEGLELKAYKCPAGKYTIGWGHTGSDVYPGLTISPDVADKMLNEDLVKFEEAVSRLVKVTLRQNQFDALVSFTFNFGEGNLKKSVLLEKVNANPDDPEIGTQFKRWVKVGNKPVEGLIKRRNAEVELYFS
ncbi:MAG: lysozyme [Bacteroidales bacterium]|nr:lysozyme [Bacteroidales bacterium]